MSLSPTQEFRTLSLIRLVGYGLLALSFIDIIYLTIPLGLANPNWEFQTLGALIDRAPVPLLAVVLICYGERCDRRRSEFPILATLSWLALGISIFFLLVIPLSLNNTLRINQNNSAQITAQLRQSQDRLQSFKEELQQARSTDRLRETVKAYFPNANIPADANPQVLKESAFKTLQEAEKSLNTQAEMANYEQRSSLLRDAMKWNLSAFIVSFLWFRIWRKTSWTRRKM